MLPEQRDAAYLWDMREAAREAVQFASSLTYAEYLSNRLVQLAVEREVEIIGEAARKISEEFKQAHAEIPWKKVVAQRHVLAHEYGQIKQDRMWLLVTTHIPGLLRQLDPIIPPLPHETTR